MISESVVFRNVIVYITISSRSFVFSQSRVEASTSLSNIGGLAVGAFDTINNYLAQFFQKVNIPKVISGHM